MSNGRSFRGRGRRREMPCEIELSPEERRELFERGVHRDVFGKEYYCLHCEEVINTEHFKAVLFPGMDKPLVTCPNWPSCDGDFKDWFATKETVRWMKENVCPTRHRVQGL